MKKLDLRCAASVPSRLEGRTSSSLLILTLWDEQVLHSAQRNAVSKRPARIKTSGVGVHARSLSLWLRVEGGGGQERGGGHGVKRYDITIEQTRYLLINLRL